VRRAFPTSVLVWTAVSLGPPARAESNTDFQPELHLAGLSTYDGSRPAETSADAQTPSLRLTTLHTSASGALSETAERDLERNFRRLFRQRHAHIEFCSLQADLPPAPTTLELHLRVESDGTRWLESPATPDFATCLAPLVERWPMPAATPTSRTTVRYQSVAASKSDDERWSVMGPSPTSPR
jgi:hypothetical protein